jgi:HEAT repeat protein
MASPRARWRLFSDSPAIHVRWRSNRPADPKIFEPLKAMLKDRAAKVRHRAALAVGAYLDPAAFKALAPLVDDQDAGVSEQATIAIGWLARPSTPENPIEQEAIALLKRVAQRRDRAGQAARSWLEQHR